MSRKRDYIPYPERLAAVLSMLLSQEERDALREAKVTADDVIALFEFDHNVLHAHDGSDKWWNLTPMQVKPHRQKSSGDTKIAAKIKRIIANEQEHREARRRILYPDEVTPREILSMARKAFRNPGPKRKIPSRPMRKACSK
jgi:hypothetical protein